jgi:hypothetical protein
MPPRNCERAVFAFAAPRVRAPSSRSSAAGATAMSDGCVAMHRSDQPRIARFECSPSRAGQPEPGSRLLQGFVTSWK